MDPDRLKELESRIGRLEAIEAIKTLKARYAAACDDNYNPEGIGKLFTEDAVWYGEENFGTHKGREAIKAFFAEVSKDIEFAVHYFVQPIIEVSPKGDTATGRWYLWQAATMKGGRAVWLAGLEYDKYRKIDGQWLQSDMRLEIFFLTPYEEGWHKTRMML